MTIEEQAKLARERLEKLKEVHDEELNNKYYYTDEEKEEIEEEKTRIKKEAIEKEIFKYADREPNFVKRFINRYTKKEVKEEIRRNKTLKKLTPAIVGVSMIGGMVIGGFAKKNEIKNDNLVISKSYEQEYNSINEAPISVVEAYVENEMDEYSKEVNNGNIKVNSDFQDTFREFQKNLNEGNIDKAMENANTLNNMTINDMTEKTMPFEKTIYSGASVDENGEVILPVTSLDEIDNNTDLTYDGGLKRKGR